MLAFCDLETDRLEGWFYERKGTKEVLDFLKRVRFRYPAGETLHVVLDNHSPHVSSSVLEWVKENDAISCFTPANLSWLNGIECHVAVLIMFALAGA